jgi:hypothetical protein
MKLTEEVVQAVLDKMSALNVGPEDLFKDLFVGYECKYRGGQMFTDEEEYIFHDVTLDDLVYLLSHVETEKEAIIYLFKCSEKEIDDFSAWVHSIDMFRCRGTVKNGSRCKNSVGGITGLIDFDLYLNSIKETGLPPVWYCKRHSK